MRLKPLPPDRSLLDQVMRPVVLTQLLFVGYTCLSSIFFFLDVQGYYYFSRDPLSALPAEYIAITAEAQRLYVLAHAGVAAGMLALMDYRRSGGYLWGTGLVYTALFAILWKGSSFEFFFNAVVWSFVLMVPLFWVGRLTGVIVRHEDLEPAEQEARPEGRRPFRSSAWGLWAAG